MKETETLVTSRLELRPLTLAVVTALIDSRPRSEIEALLGAELPWAWPTRALVDQVFPVSIEAIASAPEQRLWGDRLVTTREAAPKIIGSILFHGRPGEDGVAELTYGIEDGSQGRGYATEAVSASIAWALAQPECRVVRAKTTVWHKASKRLLEKVGMRVVAKDHDAEGAEMLTYEIARGDGEGLRAG